MGHVERLFISMVSPFNRFVLLLLALAQAKEKGYRTQCVNNLKQINLGSLMYAQDNADTLFVMPNPNPYPNGSGFFYKELMKSYV